MKKIILISLLSFFTLTTFSQKRISSKDQIISREHSTSFIENVDFSKIYNKQTGKIIPEKEFFKLIEKNPHLPLEKEIGIDGKVTRYLVDLTITNSEMTNVVVNRKKVEKGELFPNFIMTTIDNKKIELDKLKGKIVILRFEMEANTFRFQKQQIIDLDNKINQLKNHKNQIESIIIFLSPLSEVKQGFDLKNSNFNVVANGRNFRDKFSITSFPTTLVIDKNGFLLDYFNRSEDIDFKQMISE